jgi:hypothetical protein
MAMPKRIYSAFGMVFFLLGILLLLSLSSLVVWGEIEARVYDAGPGEASLKISCPLMLAPGESSWARATIVNSTGEIVTPLVHVEISHDGGARQLLDTLTLAPGEIKSVKWAVDSADVIFNSLILVNIYQSAYSILPAHIGYCSILQFNLFDLSGNQTFTLLTVFGFVFVLLGALSWFFAHEPLDQNHGDLARAGVLITALVIVAIFAAWMRWWGLALFLDGFSFLTIGLILIDITIFPSRMTR